MTASGGPFCSVRIQVQHLNTSLVLRLVLILQPPRYKVIFLGPELLLTGWHHLLRNILGFGQNTQLLKVMIPGDVGPAVKNRQASADCVLAFTGRRR